MVSVVTFTPLLGALVLLFLKSEHEKGARWIAFVTSLLTFVLSLELLRSFDSTVGGFQLVERVSWIPDFGIDYHVGIDGID